MSRIGLKPITVPHGVSVKIQPGVSIVKGPKGELHQHLPSNITVEVEGSTVQCKRHGNSPPERAAHGLVRALIANQVKGVTEGFRRDLSIVGVGYKAEAKGKSLTLNVGYSHVIEYPIPEGIQVTTPDATRIVVTGADKQLVGQVAAEIRGFRPPEPYKGKGIRYENEFIQKKAGKTAAKA
jgi:large subunit ribosomal protein L6